MSNDEIRKNIGHATSYGYAKSTGRLPEGMTEDEYAELMADYVTVGQTAVAAKNAAVAAKDAAETAAGTATTKAAEAGQSATTATNAASAAQADADAAALDASQAMSAASTATTKAEEAATSAATATNAKDAAVTAKTAAQAAQTAAETAEDNAETSATAAAASAASVAGSAAQIQTNAEDISQLKSDLSDKANPDGTYDGMTVGSAKQLLSEKYLLDEEPYLFRASGGDGSDRVEECIVGGSVGWNQLVQNGDFADSSVWRNGQSYINDGKLTLPNRTDGGDQFTFIDGVPFVIGHKYCIYAVAKATDTTDENYSTIQVVALDSMSIRVHKYDAYNIYAVRQCTSVSNRRVLIQNGYGSGVIVYSIMLIDLTALFGSTIADYIYSLEQATAGAGVAWFRKYFPEDYYPYSAPTLRHVEGVSQKEVVGWNQWDEEWELGQYDPTTGQPITNTTAIRSKNLFPVLANTTYYFKIPIAIGFRIFYYDNGGNMVTTVSGTPNATFTTPSGISYAKFHTGTSYGSAYNNDICISLSLSDPTKNGVYEPYRKNIYPLDSSLTLRGIPKLTDGKMWFDGDKYNADGSVTRNTILRAYQSGDESLANAITDGTNTVVYSANASTETATPYTALQTLDPNGTEEFVSTGIVPVGHYSKYLENLRSKIEGLPKDFSTLIAPTEKEYKATQNYTVGSLLIVDNILYKVTSAIANGGTITPNTNVTATTLAAVIAAL